METWSVWPRFAPTLPEARHIFDANEGWSAAVVGARCAALAELGVGLIEQPVPAADDAVLAEFEHPVLLCADESCHTRADLDRLVGRSWPWRRLCWWGSKRIASIWTAHCSSVVTVPPDCGTTAVVCTRRIPNCGEDHGEVFFRCGCTPLSPSITSNHRQPAMTTELVQLSTSDFQDAMDFLNMVFGAHRPHDFETLLPAIYRPTDEAMRCLYALRESGRIRAIVGLHPMSWQVADVTLQVAGIGGVSTHPKFRRAGYMRRLMTHCLQSMRDTGCQLSYLGGQRQRYAYYGYERCGHALRFTVNRTNLRHVFGDTDGGIRFAPLTGDDPAQVERARTVHDAQPAHCWRQPSLFLSHLHNWHARPHVALDDSDTMIGYVVVDASGEQLGEVVAASDDSARRMVQAWVAQHAAATVSLSTLQPQRLRALGQWCDSVSILPTGNWQVFDWPSVAGALLAARRRTSSLLEGCVVVGIGDMGGLRLEVDGNGTQCAWTHAKPDVHCDQFTAMRLLMGPAAPSQVMELPRPARLLEQWCPLPLFWSRPDGV